MNIALSITDRIGNTPLVRLNRVVSRGTNLVAAKLESLNPAFSVKDRAALGMIDDAERRRVLKPGGTLVEATSGNTGIALAMIAAARGYRLVVTMPESMSAERRVLLSGFGARVELTPSHLGMKGAIDRAHVLAGEIPGAFLVGQFENRANPAIHETTTAEEILRDTGGKIDVFVAGVGTGGTITGVGRRLKKHNRSIKMVAVEPASSRVLSGGTAGPHMIQGIGAGFVPPILDSSVIDEIVTVGDQEAFEWTGALMAKEGILAGISSGAAACGAQRYISKHKLQDKMIVVLFPDTGERYGSILAGISKQ